MPASSRMAPSALGLNTSAATPHDRVGRHGPRAELLRQPRGARGIDVGQRQPRAIGREQPGDAAAHAAGALDRDMHARDAVAPELVAHRGANAVDRRRAR